MQHAEIKVLLVRQMPHTGDECLPERPIIGPFGKDFVDGGVVNGRFPGGVLRHGQALPLHPRVEDPSLIELGGRELDGNRCRNGLFSRHGHDILALFEDT
jgi:hypothetical protein